MAIRKILLATVAMSGVLSMGVPTFAADPTPPAATTPAAPAPTAPAVTAVAEPVAPAAAAAPSAPATPAGPAPTAPTVAAPVAPAAAPSAPAPAAAAPVTPTVPARLTGIAAWSTLIGNTVQGKDGDKDYWEFYLADGKVKALTGANDLVTGKWSVEGDKVCIQFPSEAKDCYLVEVIGDIVNFTDEHGKGVRWAVMKGNPKSL